MNTRAILGMRLTQPGTRVLGSNAVGGRCVMLHLAAQRGVSKCGCCGGCALCLAADESLPQRNHLLVSDAAEQRLRNTDSVA